MKTILVVDDEPAIVQIARDYLDRAGYRVLTAGDGPGALRLARAERPALLVLDLMLPGMDGLDVTRALRQDPTTRRLPIIMLTARVEEADRLIGLELGADDYITKPFSPRELVARVRAVLRRSEGEAATGGVVHIGELSIDFEWRSVRRAGEPIAFDDRNLSWYTDKEAVSIWTVEGRQHIPYSLGEHQRKLLPFRKGESDLVYHKGVFYLLAVCEVPEPDEQQMDGVLGVDLGIVNLTTDSDGESHSGEPVDRKREWYARRRAALQEVGTKSAKRRLRQLSGRQRRFQKDTNHRISKRLVAKAERTKRAIAVEALTGIRQRTRARGPEQRARHNNWAFAQLRQFISYKARQTGVPVLAVDPRNTSRTCWVCGHCEKANRRSRAEFCCVSCGHQAPADVNAALNIRDRANVRWPMVSSLRVEAQAHAL